MNACAVEAAQQAQDVVLAHLGHPRVHEVVAVQYVQHLHRHHVLYVDPCAL